MPRYYDLGNNQYVEIPDSMSDEEALKKINVYQSSQNKIPEMEWGKEAVLSPRVLKELGKGFGSFGKGAYAGVTDVAKNIANVLLPKEKQIPLSEKKEGDVNYQSGQFLGEMLPFAALGGPVGAALRSSLKGAEAIPYVGRAAKALGAEKLIPTVGRRALATGAYSATQSPEDRLGGAITGGVLSGLIDAPTETLKSAARMTPFSKETLERNFGRVLSGKPWQEELKERVEASKGLETGLGDVFESPSLRGLHESVLSRLPLVAGPAKQRTAKKITQQTTDLLDNYRKGVAAKDVPENFVSHLKNLYEKHKNEKNKIYKGVQYLLDQSGHTFDFPNSEKALKEATKDLEGFELLKANDSTLKNYRKLKGFLDKKGAPDFNRVARETVEKNFGKEGLQNDSLINSVKKAISNDSELSRQLARFPEYAEMKVLKNELGALGNVGLKRGEKNAYAALKLSKALDKDIKTGIEKGPGQLKKMADRADKFYREKYLPFLDKDIMNLMFNEKVEPEQIAQSLFNKPNSPRLIRKSMDILDKRGEDLLKSTLFGSEGRGLVRKGDELVADPIRFAKHWNDLKTPTREALVPMKAERKELDQLGRAIKMNQSALNKLDLASATIPTGQKVLDLLGPLVAVGSFKFPAAMAALYGSGYGAQKAITSPALREFLAKRALKEPSKGKIPKQVKDLLRNIPLSYLVSSANEGR